MKLKITLVFVFFALAGNFLYSENEYEILFGIIKEKDCSLEPFIHQTKRIPFKLKETGFTYGYTIRASYDTPFETYAIIFPPGTIDEYSTGDISSKYRMKGTVTPRKRLCCFATFLLQFDKNDVPGRYKIVIYINNRPYRFIDYHVYVPGKKSRQRDSF